MRPRFSEERLLPLFAKVGALKDMSLVARELVMARKAVAEIRAIEDKLEAMADAGSPPTEEAFALAMRETAKYAGIAARSAKTAVGVLKALKPRLESYLRQMKALR